MTKVYISLEKPICKNGAMFICLPIFDFSRAIFKEPWLMLLSRDVTKPDKNNNNEASLETEESPKPVIFNENDTDKIYH